MNISANVSAFNATQNQSAIKTNFTEKLSKEEVIEIKEQLKQNAQVVALNSTSIQVGITSNKDDFVTQYEEFQTFLSDIGYDGKPIAELSQEEAAELVSEDGFFGITQTSERIANFVINGSAGDEDRLRAGREGMLAGFKMAEEMWGGELPEISQKTMQAAIEMVDKEMHGLGYSILNQEV